MAILLSSLYPESQCLLAGLAVGGHHKIAVHILGRGVFGLLSHPNLPMLRCMNIAMMVGTPVKVLSPSLHETCVPVLQQLQMQ